jgi:hypothetical protein
MAAAGHAETIGDTGIPDLGALRSGKSGEGEAPPPELPRIPGRAFYANDFQPSYDPGGTVTIEFFFKTERGQHDPVTVSLPMPVFVELCGVGDQIKAHVDATVAEMRRRLGQQGGPPASMDAAKAARDR